MVVESKKFTENQELIAKYANALANPIRVAILDLLAVQSCCYHGDMSDILPIANSTLSQHLKVLKEVGFIKGEINPPKTKYCIDWDEYKKALALFQKFLTNASDCCSVTSETESCC